MLITRYIKNFLDWWLTSLLDLVPERLRLKIFQYPDRLQIEFENGKITISYYNGNSKELIDKKVISREDELGKASIIQWLSQVRSNYVENIVLVPPKHILQKNLKLPLSSENNIREIIGFEMDRQTPFSTDQVYYDTRIIARDTEQEKLSLDLFVATRDYIDSLLAEIRNWSLSAVAVTFREKDGPAGINLLPDEEKTTPRGKHDTVTVAGSIITFILFLTALYLPLLHQRNAISILENKVTTSRDMARQIQPLITEKEKILERDRFLTEKRLNKLPVIKVLDELTKILPDDTYLERLTIRGDEMQINGESSSATSIIQLLEKSAYFQNTQPRSPITKDVTTSKERFFISATLVADTGKVLQ